VNTVAAVFAAAQVAPQTLPPTSAAELPTAAQTPPTAAQTPPTSTELPPTSATSGEDGGVGPGESIAVNNDFQQNKAALASAGLLTPSLLPYFAEEAKPPQAAEVIMLLANLYAELATG
jgi:hypothetical protein